MPQLQVSGPAGSYIRIIPSELLGADGSITTAAQEQEIVVPGAPMVPVTVPDISLFADEIKKKPKKEKKAKKSKKSPLLAQLADEEDSVDDKEEPNDD